MLYALVRCVCMFVDVGSTSFENLLYVLCVWCASLLYDMCMWLHDLRMVCVLFVYGVYVCVFVIRFFWSL